MKRTFDLRPSDICRIFNESVERMNDTIKAPIRCFESTMLSDNLRVFSDAIEEKSGVPLNCVGFIDITNTGIWWIFGNVKLRKLLRFDLHRLL